MKELDVEEEDEYEADEESMVFLIKPNPNSLWNRFKRWLAHLVG